MVVRVWRIGATMWRSLVRQSRCMTCIADGAAAFPRVSQGFSTRSRSPKGRGKGGDASIRQHRLASEVKSIISAALQQGPCNVTLLQRCGFEVEQVKMSGDLRKAFVLWKALPGMHQTVEKELSAQGKRLRSMVFEHLSMPFSPAIEFRQDKITPQAQAIDDILAKLDEESDSNS